MPPSQVQTTTLDRTAISLAVAIAMIVSSLSLMPSSSARARPPKLDDGLTPSATRAIIQFDHDVDASTISRVAQAGVTDGVVLDTIDSLAALGSFRAFREVATWDDVVVVDEDSRIRVQNYLAKKDTNVSEVRDGVKPLSRAYDGTGVTVAVLDTGIATHPDLEGRVVEDLNFEGSWFYDSLADGAYSDRIDEATGNQLDLAGHGTHVAGIVGGTGAAASGAADMSGVAPGAKLANFKIGDAHQGLGCDFPPLPCEIGWEANALVAYEYLIEHRREPRFGTGIQVVNNSWDIAEANAELEPINDMVRAANRKGIVNVFGAGNGGPDPNSVSQGPNRLREVITVAAACKSAGSCGEGNVARFSSRGRQVDVAAPGQNVYSTISPASVRWPLGGHSPPNGGSDTVNYASLSGTSMAAPHVSGVVALMLEANPDLSPSQIRRLLCRSAIDFGRKGFDTSFGCGLVDALAAVDHAERKADPTR